MTETSCDVLVVGAGAAGLTTAIFAGRTIPGLRILVLERAKKPGAKILVSGGGRCNVTNASVSERDFWGGRPTIIRQVLRGFPVADTVAFFTTLGVPLHEEPAGKLFPDSNRSRDVLDALLAEAQRVGARLLTEHRVLAITPDDGVFQVHTEAATLTARAVVLAAGGNALPKSGSDGSGVRLAHSLGHTIVPTTPALAPLRLEATTMPALLSGVTHEAELTLWEAGRVSVRLAGPLLWTHFGVSGPVALNMSRHWARAGLNGGQPRLTVSFGERLRLPDIEAELIAEARSRPRASVQTILGSRLPASLAAALCEQAEVGATALSQLPREDRRRLGTVLTELPLPVVETRGYTYAEATAGGVALGEIDPSSMESRVCAGLFLAGEVLDVDGRLGGFNYQWAWASARAAARGLALRLADDRR